MAENFSSETESVIVIGQLKIDLPARCAWLGRRLLDLSLLEFEILLYLTQHAGWIVTLDELLREIWGCSLKGGGTTGISIEPL